jgi:hypothetical protein
MRPSGQSSDSLLPAGLLPSRCGASLRCTGEDARAYIARARLHYAYFSRRVVAFHILIHQLDELGDDVVAFESGELSKVAVELRSAVRFDFAQGRLTGRPWPTQAGPIN